MNSTALRYFLAVAQHNSLTAAAEQLHVATSAISRQIAQLESHLGVNLFERLPRGMVLTAAGQQLARHARRAFLDEEAIVNELRQQSGMTTGVVRIASIEGFSSGLILPAAVSFRRRYPGIRIELRVIYVLGEVVRMVRDGEVDIGASFSYAPESGVNVVCEGLAPLRAMMPRKHRLARRASVSLRELAQEPMALTPENHSVRRLFDIACGRAGVTVEPVFVSNQSAALFAFAAGGNGITLASPFAAHYPDVAGKVALVPIKSPTLDQRYYQVQTMAGRRLPEAVSAFAEHLVKIIDGLK